MAVTTTMTMTLDIRTMTPGAGRLDSEVDDAVLREDADDSIRTVRAGR